jgi:hypothetical protein
MCPIKDMLGKAGSELFAVSWIVLDELTREYNVSCPAASAIRSLSIIRWKTEMRRDVVIKKFELQKECF